MPNGRNYPKHSHDQPRANYNIVGEQLRDRTLISNRSVLGSWINRAGTLSRENHKLRKDEVLTYYPAYCHKASPTWFEWVKLTAQDIHTRLHIRDGYQHSWLTEYRFYRDAPQLMFYLNHPIQFVQIVGVVVSFDEYFDRFWLFTIDDSSGLTIDVVCRKPAKEKSEAVHPGGSTLYQKSEDEKDEEKEIQKLSNLVISTVELGSVLQVKGVITLFRRNQNSASGFGDLKSNIQPIHSQREEAIRQISLQRVSKVRDTNHEVSLIAARTQLYKSVLAQPWALSNKEQEKLHKEALGDIEHDKKRVKRTARKRQRLIEVEKEDAEKIRKEYEKEEGDRAREAEVARLAGERLREKLERERMQAAGQIAPKADGPLSKERSGIGKDHAVKRSRKQGQDSMSGALVNPVPNPEQQDATNESFGPLEDEKSALLRLAFG